MYSIQIIPNADDMDELGHVNNQVYVRWIQEVAQHHWQAFAAEELRNSYFWVVVRHEIDYKQSILPGQPIEISTWIESYSAATSIRMVKILVESKLVAQARTTWCLLDSTSRRPVRIPDTIQQLFPPILL